MGRRRLPRIITRSRAGPLRSRGLWGARVGCAEHLFLGMLHDGGWPMNVISSLVDLGRAEAAVLGIVNGPGYSPPPRFPMREGDVRMWGRGGRLCHGRFLYRRGARVPGDNPDT